MNCEITSANSVSGPQADISRISTVQLAVSVRKSTSSRPFICPILGVMPSKRMSRTNVLPVCPAAGAPVWTGRLLLNAQSQDLVVSRHLNRESYGATRSWP